MSAILTSIDERIGELSAELDALNAIRSQVIALTGPPSKTYQGDLVAVRVIFRSKDGTWGDKRYTYWWERDLHPYVGHICSLHPGGSQLVQIVSVHPESCLSDETLDERITKAIR